MRRLAVSVLVVVSLLSVLSGVAHGQRRAAAAVGAGNAKVALLEQPATLPPRQPTSMAPYLLAGSLIGAGATVAAIWVSLSRSNAECICSPVAFAPVVAGGAVVGALIGVIVYGVRRSARERTLSTVVQPDARE